MSATTLTDKFLNAVARWSGQVGAAGVSSASATTIPLQSSTGLVNGRVYWFTLNRLTGTTKNAVSNTEGFPGIINTTTHEITTTALLRGSEGTATAWAAGTLVEILHSAGYMNRFIEGIEAEHDQSGAHKSSVVDGTKVYAADAGSTDAYAITLSPVPAAYATGQTFRFKANTVNTGPATLNVNSLGAKTIKKNYNSDLADGDILANQLVEVIYDGTNFQMLSPISNVSSGILSTTQYAPQGFLINGKIVPSVASNNLTVAIKGMDGNDPSASNPVYCRIGDTVRTITAALSVTKNAGTNWCNAGSAELATKEIDYFVYLGYNATDGVVIGFSRIPYATRYDSFSTTSTAEKYCAISTITTAAAGDYYEVIGRFAATLSAGAGYTWSVPTFTATNLIQRPIYETRWLSWLPAVTGGTSLSYGVATYKIQGDMINVNCANMDGTSNANTKTFVAPMAASAAEANIYNSGFITLKDNGAQSTTIGHLTIGAGSSSVSAYRSWYQGAWTTSGTFTIFLPNFIYQL